MGRHASNRLTIKPRPSGGWVLTGYFLGRQIRKQHRDQARLEAVKVQLEQQLVQHGQRRQELRHTWLSPEQLRDAEAAVGRAGEKSLLSCVIAAEAVMTVGVAVKCAQALQDWLTALRERKRTPATLAKNRLRVEAFIEAANPKHLADITDRMIERWVYRKGSQDYTRLTDAAVIRAWLAWCVRRRLIGRSPFAIDMKDLQATARPVERPRILTAEQCWGLLAAAEAHDGGKLAPYVVLATWCFMRPSEIGRTVPQDLKLDGARPVIEVWPKKRGTPSYRTVDVPACVLGRLRGYVQRGLCEPMVVKVGKKLEARGIFYSKTMWETVRAAAGLVTLSKPRRHGRRKLGGGVWQHDILRHSGISYFYQRSGDIKETCRQAGNTSDVSFRHYLQLPAQGEAERFYREG